MTEQWQELKETIIELRDSNGTGTQQEVCKFLANYMDILEKQTVEPNRCDSCTHSKEQNGSNCYECVKGMADNFEAQPTDKCKGCYYNDGEAHAECVVCDKEAQSTDAVRLISSDDIMAHFPKANFNGKALENKKAYPYWKTDITGLISILKSVPIVKPCEDAVSRKLAIEHIKGCCEDDGLYCVDDGEIIINIIKALPSVTPQRPQPTDAVKCDCNTEEITKSFIEDVEAVKDQLDGQSINAVSREAVKNGMIKYGFHAPDMTVTEFVEDCLPPVIPQRKKGRWINKFGKEQGYDIAGIKTWYIQIMCDKCGFIKTAIEGHTGQYHYCPNCGAEMGGAND